MIEIESVKRLDIKPGETLVVRTPTRDPAEINRIRDGLRTLLPEGTGVMVISPDVELTVLSPAGHNMEGGIEGQAGDIPHPPTFTPPPTRQAATTERPIG